MYEVIEKENIKIEDMIYEINGKQVIFDSDLARLYGTETKRINEAVRRNIKRFPYNFCFQVTENELSKCSRSQFATLNKNGNKRGNNIKYLPYVFTEQGVAMLSSVLHTETAINTSIQIINAFIAMRKYISSSLCNQNHINNMVLDHEERLKIVESTFSKFQEKNNHIFFDGQIYDAYSIMIDIINTSKSEIIIIDNYVDKNILDILSKTNKNIILITNQYNNNDYNKYQKQYNNIKLVINNNIHDRFIIIDKKDLYHCGASFKDLGKKCFAITKIEDDEILKRLLNNI